LINQAIYIIPIERETKMTPILTKILLSLLWAALGALGAWLSFLSLQKQASSIQPNGEAPFMQLPKMMAGRTIRLLLIGVALYLALIMNPLYGIVFVVALTLTTWALVMKLNRRVNKPFDDQQ
jgi:hypothetical protein